MTILLLTELGMNKRLTISVKANLRMQVKGSGRSQNSSTERRAHFWSASEAFISARANLCSRLSVVTAAKNPQLEECGEGA